MIEDTSEEVNKSIDSLSTDLKIRLTDFESKMKDRSDHMDEDKISRSMLGDTLTKSGRKIKA
ncbi:MAG: hypothetical protein ABF247_08720 [Nonlabens sp.]|uniref:hypothetical protein n=1 Tax=Nonlabens sp. TaxID=1888209 RepID=UPI003219045F